MFLDWKSYPTNPGVYLMKDASGSIIYIGKAKNLRLRLKSYLKNMSDIREQIPFLMKRVANIETITVSNETEALLLENNLIKKHRPRYNILLKDDKTFYSLIIDLNNPWPKINLIRTKTLPLNKQNVLIFGPFPNSESCKTLLSVIQELFPLRTCSDRELLSRRHPCLLYDMNKCLGPCCGLCTKEEYDILVKGVILFLKRGAVSTLNLLKKEIVQASQNLEFEKADKLYKTVRLLKTALMTQKVEKTQLFDIDVIGFFRKELQVIVTVLTIRKGKLINAVHHISQENIEDTASLIASFLIQNYEGIQQLPHKILVPVKIPNIVSECLKTNIQCPLHGEGHKLIAMASINAEDHFNKILQLKVTIKDDLSLLCSQLRLNHFPKRIECYDGSHLHGKDAVSTFVTFINGESSPENYRTFIAKQEHKGNDYSLLKEIIKRRFGNFTLNTIFPDLIIIDGGKNHLQLVIETLEELNIHNIDVIAIAKESGKHDKGLRREKIHTRKSSTPIILPFNSPVLLLIQKIRDEAHRFTISFHRKRRSKSLLGDKISISGIGPKKQKALLDKFKNWSTVFTSNYTDLKEVKELSEKDIRNILAHTKSHTFREKDLI
ncbi:MAG: excinuclease ABC subunit UvrC [Victivallaceae bacterium]